VTAISLAYVQQLREFCVRDRPRSIFAELHTNKAGVEVERQMSKQFCVLENVLKLICITHTSTTSHKAALPSYMDVIPILYNGPPLPMGEIWTPHVIHGSLCPLESTRNPNGISTCSASFAGLTIVTDRQTDHATRSVRIGHIVLAEKIIVRRWFSTDG